MFKSYPRNRFLYHYTRSEIAIKYILPSMKLKFSPYSETNDPFETKEWSLTIINSLKELEKIKGRKKREMLSLIMKFNESRWEYTKEVKRKLKIACFSMDVEGFNLDYKVKHFGYKRAWGYPRMWAQYGEKHKGVCLMFDKEKFERDLEIIFAGEFDIYKRKIVYKDGLIADGLHSISLRSIVSKGIDQAIKERLTRNIERFFFKKAKDWRDEREFRYLLYPKYDKGEDLYFPITNSLKVIIIGADIEEKEEKEILNIAKKLEIRVYKVDWAYGFPMIENLGLEWATTIPNPFL